MDFDYDFKMSITVVNRCLISTFQKDITDRDMKLGISRIITKVNSLSIVGAIFDLRMLSSLDSYTFDLLQKASKVISIMGVKVVWSGLRPGVISALLDLNVDVSAIKVALNLEQGFEIVLKN
jgi:anti-anti-sigma regulatory factor